MKNTKASIFLLSLICIFIFLYGCNSDGNSVRNSDDALNKPKSEDPIDNPINIDMTPIHPEPPNYMFQMQKPEPVEITFSKEEYSDIKITGESRFGSIILESDGKALLQTNVNTKRYTSNFSVQYINAKGEIREIEKFDDYIEEDVKSWKWQVIEYELFDLFIFLNNQSEFYKHEYPLGSIRAFVITEDNESFPLDFLIHTKDGDKKTSEFTIHRDFQISNGNGNLIVHSTEIQQPSFGIVHSPEIQRFTFAFDLEEKAAAIEKIENLSESYSYASNLAWEQSELLEIILLFGVGENQKVIDATEVTWTELLKLVSEKASQRKSFQYIIRINFINIKPCYD